ncbi:MAG: rRNA maturation RNase YbeY [Candidatus Veblenbacteria bacterium]|nr:rRNA maturation RNase YbeY [Candidatus Veblenbacteria bacterium]MDZ4229904.1 rRNA maturation RNase YbeY [Candidatus Veblenbacteria bacterium]
MAVTFSYHNVSRMRIPPAFRARARRLLSRVEKLTGKRWGEVGLIFVSGLFMRRLNATYRHYDRVTDVLSFTYQARSPVVGEIFICVEQAARQARTARHSLGAELEFLFVHGLLHLLGHDHLRAGERSIMRALEYQALGLRSILKLV